MKKKPSGRRKIEIKRIENNNSRHVAFSKRRNGLFKKASELCVLTGVEMAILVQSPGGRVFGFGHPDVDSVISNYLGNNVSNASENPTCMHEEYNDKYSEIAKEVEVEKIKLNDVDESWWEKSFDNLEIDEIENYIKSMEELKNKVTERADELSNLVRGSSLSRSSMNTSNVTMRADEVRNLVTSCSFDTYMNESNVDQLVDDQVILPNLDHFLPHNVGNTDEV